MIILELLFVFIIVMFIMRLIGFYVWSHETLKRFKEIRAEKKANKKYYQENYSEPYKVEKTHDETDDWIYDRRTKKFIHKDEYFKQ